MTKEKINGNIPEVLEIVTVGGVENPATGQDGNVDDIRRTTATELRDPEQGCEIDERLMSLVVEPINALPAAKRTVLGKVRSGEEIARAIPDVEAFLEAVSHRREGQFFELNEAGQLVMADGCPEAYGPGEDFPTATIRQTRVYYRGEDGTTQVMEGKDYFAIKEVNAKKVEMIWEVTYIAKVLELSEAAQKIDPTSIIMKSGLPTLHCDRQHKHTGEYARMNTGQLEYSIFTWTDDDSLSVLLARCAALGSPEDIDIEIVGSIVTSSDSHNNSCGSRGVLRVNLNFES